MNDVIGNISHGITNKSHNLKQTQAVDRWNKLEMEQFHTPGSLHFFLSWGHQPISNLVEEFFDLESIA